MGNPVLDWSKFKAIDNKLYKPREFSTQFVFVVLAAIFTVLYWFNKDTDRFFVEALLHTFIAIFVSAEFIYVLFKHGKYGVPLIQIEENSILVRKYGRFKERKYNLVQGDKVYIVGKPGRKYIRIESLNGESRDIRFFELSGSAPIEFIQKALSKRMPVFCKEYPIEPV